MSEWLIIHGDCRKLPIDLAAVDAVVTDPPYGVKLTKKTSDYRQSKRFDNGESLRASRNYEDDPDKIAELIRATMPRLLLSVKCAIVFCGTAMMFEYPRPDGIGCVYTPNGAGRSRWGFQCCHPILYYGKDPFLLHGMGSRPNSFRTEQPNREVIDHPCPKPLDWMVWAVERCSFPGDLILDPFMGSGTTGLACLMTGRRFIGVEIDARYCAIARRRIERPHAPAIRPGRPEHHPLFDGAEPC